MSKKILFWLGVFAVSLLVMVQPARAETILATPGAEQPATWAGSVCGSSTVSAADACYKQLTTCGGLPVSPPSTLSYSIVSWSVNATKQCRYVSYNGSVGGFGNVNTTCTAGTFEAATNKCFVYSCPAGQNWTLTGGTCSRPDCVEPLVRSVSTGLCVAPPVSCPTMSNGSPAYSGYEFVSVPTGVDPNAPMSDLCDFNNCAVNVNVVSSIFSVALVRKIPTDYSCPTQPGQPSIPATLTVTFTSAADPQKTNFDDVIAKAAPVSAPATAAAVAASTASAQVVQDRISVVGSGVTDAYAKALEKETAAKEVQKAGQEFIANPTPQTLENYNQKMTDYNGKSVASDSALTKVASDWQVLNVVKKSAQQQADAGVVVSQKIAELQQAVAVSGQPFNSGDISAKIGDLAGLQAANASALAKLAEAITKLQAVQGDVTNITNTNTTNSTTVNDTAKAVEAVASGAGSGAPASGVSAASAVPPAETPIDCNADPTNAACTTECQKHPELAVCAELGTVSDDVPLVEKEINISAIQPVQVGNAGACPAPLPMVLHGQTYFMKFDTYCNFGTGIKPIILAFAWLAAAGILIGGFRAA